MKGKGIKGVLAMHTNGLMALPGVVGVGEGECGGGPCIIVFVAGQTAGLGGQVPSEIEGYPVKVEESGEFRARP